MNTFDESQTSTKHNTSNTQDTNKKRWDSNQKKELMKLYSKGKSYQEIGAMLNRSPNAIKLRVESIIYDNLVRGKSVNTLSKMLNADSDMIKQLYYSHKSFKQSRNEPTTDVDFTQHSLHQNAGRQIIYSKNSHKGSDSKNSHKGSDSKNSHKGSDSKNSQKGSNSNHLQKRSKDDNILERLESENRLLDEIIKNHQMKKHIRKLYVDGKLDKRSLSAFEKIVKS
jgi:hypothetical protein